MISRCDALYVLTIEGWRTSYGVKGEVEIAKGEDVPVRYYDPMTDTISVNPKEEE